MKKISVICAMAVVLLLQGCANFNGWKYTSEPKEFKQPDVNLSVAVPPFQDLRNGRNSLCPLCIFALWVPFVPYIGVSEVNTPEVAQNIMTGMKPQEDLAKAIAEELENATIFKKSFFSYDKEDGDLVLVGKINRFAVEQYSTMYGISAFGEVLWVLGAPFGRTHNIVDIDYQILKNGTYEVVFNKNYYKDLYWNQGAFLMLVPYGNEMNLFEKVVKDINMEFIADVKKNLEMLKKLAPTTKKLKAQK